MSIALYLAEIVYWDVGSSTEKTLRYATQGYVTRTSETPSDTFYDGKLIQPAAISRDAFGSGTTLGKSRVGYGDLVLANDDGALDPILEYPFDGRTVTIREGVIGAAYPGGFTTRFVGTIDGVSESTARLVTFKLRDRQAKLDVPIQPTKFAGSNALPAGLEGVATDLKGKPKPKGYGSFMNASAPCVNTSKLIYQVNDGAVSDVTDVYDSGVALTDGTRWTARTAPSTGYYCAAYGNGLFLAGGAAGVLSTSPDGTTWTSRTSGFGADDIRGIAYGASIYVAVGSSGKLYTSANGTTGWTSRTSGFGALGIWDVRYNATLAVFVAVGDSGTVSTSPDGITWTARPSAATAAGASTTLYAVASDGNVFVVAGATGVIISSPDGTNWTARTTNFDGAYCRGVAYGNGTFVAGGTFLATSADGLTWTRAATPSGVSFWDVIYGSQFVAGIDNGGTSGIASSADGIEWTVQSRAVFGGAGTFPHAIAYGGGTYVGVTYGGVIASTSVTPYANTTDLLNDEYAPMAGEYIACPSAGYFRLGSSPAGLMTADVLEGTTSANRTTAQLFKRVLDAAGYVSGTDYSASDITALDALNTNVLGIWIPDETTISAVLDQIANSIGCWWGVDATGVFRIQQLLVPSGTAAASFVASDLLRPLERLGTNDEGRGVPVWRVIARYARNYTVQSTDLAGSVTDARRAIVGEEWRAAKYETASVQTAHPLSPELSIDTLLTVEADALAEATRVQTLRGTRRDRYKLTVALDATTGALDLGNVVDLTHTRFGLSGTKKFRVIGVAPDYANRRTELTIWGGV